MYIWLYGCMSMYVVCVWYISVICYACTVCVIWYDDLRLIYTCVIWSCVICALWSQDWCCEIYYIYGFWACCTTGILYVVLNTTCNCIRYYVMWICVYMWITMWITSILMWITFCCICNTFTNFFENIVFSCVFAHYLLLSLICYCFLTFSLYRSN